MFGPVSSGKFSAVLSLALAVVPAICNAASIANVLRRPEGTFIVQPAAGYAFDSLYGFKGPADGTFPDGDLISVSDTLYGTTSSGGTYSAGTVFELSLSGVERRLYEFKGAGDGAEPFGSLVFANGYFYGTTYHGGARGEGTVYELSRSGVERVLYSFTGRADGGHPRAGLIYSNGLLYGTTYVGGTSGDGTVFEVSTSGIERVLHSFKGGTDGANPRAALISVNGALYGTTYQGGPSNLGTVFRVSTSGTTIGAERVIHSFTGGVDGDGANPSARLLAVSGELYGTTTRGGITSIDDGTVFETSTSGSETVLHAFAGGQDGAIPSTGLSIFNGQLYGTTAAQGQYGRGTVFEVPTTFGWENSVFSFGQEPSSGVLPLNGSFYGTAADGTEENDSPCGCSIVYKLSLSGVESVLHTFGGTSADGEHPKAGLVALNGSLYGTTASGGRHCAYFGCGTVFEVSTSGQERVLYTFKGGTDGAYPQAGLTALNGALYGTTGGTPYHDCGTAFEVTTSGEEHVLYRFRGGSDGCSPNSPLIALNGSLYGTTAGSGADLCYEQDDGCGTVFELSTSGQERVLHSFAGGADGASPQGLTLMNGALYGTTGTGGIAAYGSAGNGIIFEVSASGQERVLYSFKGGADGLAPNGGLVAVNGALYGTTSVDVIGNNISGGTVFEVTTSGQERVLYRFQSGLDGAMPQAGLTAANGQLYGTTSFGGALCGCSIGGYGTVFSVTTSGKESVLYRFTDGADGANPVAGLVAVNGALYGTTTAGGYGFGTIFKLAPVSRLQTISQSSPVDGRRQPTVSLHDRTERDDWTEFTAPRVLNSIAATAVSTLALPAPEWYARTRNDW